MSLSLPEYFVSRVRFCVDISTHFRKNRPMSHDCDTSLPVCRESRPTISQIARCQCPDCEAWTIRLFADLSSIQVLFIIQSGQRLKRLELQPTSVAASSNWLPSSGIIIPSPYQTTIFVARPPQMWKLTVSSNLTLILC